MTFLFSEHEFLEALEKLIDKAGILGIFVRYEFPGGNLFVTGFQPVVNADHRRVIIPLQFESPSDMADSLFEFYLPEEEHSQYRSFEDEAGDLFLEVAFPHCTRRHTIDPAYAKLQFATKQALLDSAENTPIVN